MRFSIIFLLYFGDVHIIFLFFAKPFLLCKKYLRSIPNSLSNLKLFILMLLLLLLPTVYRLIALIPLFPLFPYPLIAPYSPLFPYLNAFFNNFFQYFGDLHIIFLFIC